MHIAIYTTRYPGIGGIEKHVDVLQKTLQEKGHQVTIISANKIYKLFRSQIIAQLLGSFLFQIFYSHVNKFDIINIQSWPGGLLFYPLRAKKIKVLFTVHHTYNQQITYLGQWYKYPLMLLEKLLYGLSDKLVTVSESTQKVLISKYWIKKWKIHLLYNPFILDHGSKKMKRKSKAILFIGRLDKRKNPVFMIELMRELIKIDTDYKISLIWDGKLRKACETLSKKYKLTKNISFLWNVTEARKKYLMSTYEYLIVPSIFEGQWIVYLEWRSMWMKVLCRNCDGLRDMCPPQDMFKSVQNAISIIRRTRKSDGIHLEKFNYNNYRTTLDLIFKK